MLNQNIERLTEVLVEEYNRVIQKAIEEDDYQFLQSDGKFYSIDVDILDDEQFDVCYKIIKTKKIRKGFRVKYHTEFTLSEVLISALKLAENRIKEENRYEIDICFEYCFYAKTFNLDCKIPYVIEEHEEKVMEKNLIEFCIIISFIK